MDFHRHSALLIVALGIVPWTLSGRATALRNPASAVSSDSQDTPQLRLSANASVYRQGELIPLELSFTSKISDRYQVNMAGYDRSGRMGYEKFVVEPADGTADPLLAYFYPKAYSSGVR